MSKRNHQFGAAPSAAGYLYQARLALLLCIPHVNSGTELEVAIERLDDVSFEKDGSALELLQSKHHIDRVGNLGNNSADIWKTLRVWAVAAADDPSLPSRAKLVLMTTGKAPDETAASLLRPAHCYSEGGKRDPKLAQQLLTRVARTSTNKDLKPAFEAFLNLTEPMRAALLSAIEVVDTQPLVSDLNHALEDALRLVAPAGKAAHAREMLEGWWWPMVCSALVATPPEAIPVAAIEAKLDDIRDMLKRDALIAEFEHAEPSDAEVAGYNDFVFVKQLRIIGLGGNRLSYAKRDYYRAFTQRSRWTRQHVVIDEELKKFERTLVEEWEPRFAAMCDAHSHGEIDEQKAKQDAQEIYHWVETEARFPFRSLSAKFLNVGSYHMLSNVMRVGWHRDFQKLCGGGE